MKLEEKFRAHTARVLSVVLCLFTLVEVNYPNLLPQSRLAIFALLGLSLCFLWHPLAQRFRDAAWSRAGDWVLVLLTFVVCGYVAVQNEPFFENLWFSGQSLGNRAGMEVGADHVVAAIGLVTILEATRRVVGWILPSLVLVFVAYALLGQKMPDGLFPHRGFELERVVGQSFLHSQGVFGIALRVMFTYVFLFVVFGALLETTGATRFIIDAARRLFGRSAGAPAKVSILASGLMGSLSGSAVANTATTGTFTIPLMKSSGFAPKTAAGIEAAASSGGALVPPVMGAGAYMMLEMISTDPPVTYLAIVRAALLPAILYYFSLYMIVHLTARKLTLGGLPDVVPDAAEDGADPAATVKIPAVAAADRRLSGLIFFFSLGALIASLLAGTTVFRAVTVAMAVVVVLSLFSPRLRLTPRRAMDAFEKAARGGVTLVAAAASVGIILGVVTLTGLGSALPRAIIPLAKSNLFLALLLIMVSSIVLGMGLPSAVCYLLLATFIGPALGDLHVPQLAGHLFIFYFGLMSMVTPPVALAAYTAASIAGSRILPTAIAAFRFALIGFALPFLFVYRPQLLMLAPDGSAAPWTGVFLAFALVAAGIVPLAAALAGHLGRDLGLAWRGFFLVSAVLLFVPVGEAALSPVNAAGLVLFLGGAAWLRRGTRDE